VTRAYDRSRRFKANMGSTTTVHALTEDGAVKLIAKVVGSNDITSIGHNPFTETIYFRKYSGFQASVHIFGLFKLKQA